MFPGLNETDSDLAVGRYPELVAAGQHQQRVRRICPGPARSGPSMAALRLQLGAILVRGGQRLQGAQTVTSDRFGSLAASQRRVTA